MSVVGACIVESLESSLKEKGSDKTLSHPSSDMLSNWQAEMRECVEKLSHGRCTLEARDSSLGGRHLVSTENIPAGTSIMTCYPYVAVVRQEALFLHCSGCYAKVEQSSEKVLMRCGRCHFHRFCSKECQKMAWKGATELGIFPHKLECHVLSKTSHSLTDHMSLALRIILRKSLESSASTKDAIVGQRFRDIIALKGHYDDSDIERKQGLAQMAALILRLLHGTPAGDATRDDASACSDGTKLPIIGGATPSSTSDIKVSRSQILEAIQILARVDINAVSLSDGMEPLYPIGIAICPALSMINHSCSPNAVIVNTGASISVRSIAQIDVAEEISVCYVDILEPPFYRRSRLQRDYFFRCRCIICCGLDDGRIPESEIFATAARCPNAHCTGIVPVPVEKISDIPLEDDVDDEILMCNECRSTASLFAIRRVEKEVLTYVREAMQADSDPESVAAGLAISEKSFSLCSKTFCGTHRLTLRTALGVITGRINNKKFIEAFELARDTIRDFEKGYPAHSPLLGMRFATLGKLARALGIMDISMYAVTKALPMLQNAYGAESPLVKEVIAMCVNSI